MLHSNFHYKPNVVFEKSFSVNMLKFNAGDKLSCVFSAYTRGQMFLANASFSKPGI